MKKSLKLSMLLASAATLLSVESAMAGEFDGITIEAKLIGGEQYEGLYGRIAEWEAATGAKVDIISKKSHFEIDKEIKSDMAAGTTNWCVGSNHSSFAAQYEGLYIDLNGPVAAETIAEFVQGNINASTVGGELLMLGCSRNMFHLKIQKTVEKDDKERPVMLFPPINYFTHFSYSHVTCFPWQVGKLTHSQNKRQPFILISAGC